MRNLLRLIIRCHFFILFILLEVFSFFLIVQYNHFQKARFINFSRTLQGYFYNRTGGFKKYLSLKQVNEELFLENVLLRNQLDAFTGSISKSRSSANDSTLKRRQFSYIPAVVINNSIHKQFNFITLNRGKNHGIRSEMGVIAPDGVVGVVYAVSDNFSTVLPVLNRNFRLSAKIKKSNYFGSLTWTGRGYTHAILSEIPYHVEISPGDSIVTSGYSAFFPEGILIGTIDTFDVEEGNFYNITVRLLVDFKNLTYVQVINNLLREEQTNLEQSFAND